MTGAVADPVDAAYELIVQGQAADALGLIEPLALSPRANHAQLAAYASVLKTLGRTDDALAVYQRALAVAPTSAVAEHNVASAQGDLCLYEAAEASARRAFAKGLDAPETWTVLARALEGQGRHDDAEAAYHEALRRRPLSPDVHRDLAQMIWMKTGDVDAATRVLKAAVKTLPDEPILSVCLATALNYGGRADDAYDVLIAAMARSQPPTFELSLAASTMAGEVKETVAALRHAEAALAAAPDEPLAILALCDAQLAVGRPGPAARLAEDLHRRLPEAQHVISRLATAWRMMDDPRYGQLYDYAAMVRSWTIDTPEGWPSLDAYLADLARALRAAHKVAEHPYDQSLRGGSQTHADLARLDDPAVRSFFRAVDAPIQRHMAAIGQGDDPLRRRNTGRYRIQGAWSVRLRPNGFHVNHVHPMGWLSSACYIELPAAVAAGGHEGWLKFGEPGIPTLPAQAPEHMVKPAPGQLVLFPSYMWHGTVPFSGLQERLTVAFDVVPA